MPSPGDLGIFWRTLREVDLSVVAREAEAPLHIAVAGLPGVGKTTLIEQLRLDPRKHEVSLASVISEHDLPSDDARLSGAVPIDLALLVLDAGQPAGPVERALFQRLLGRKTPVIVVYNKADLAADAHAVIAGAGEWMPAPVVAVAATDRASLERALAPAMLPAFKGREIALARALPLFRATVVRRLIDDVSFANAAYSFSTGLAEIVPVLDVPFTVADILMLTKNQALMAFRIALAMGMSRDWRETLPQLTAVVGAAFIWRQIGRTLIGLIPAWGIIPKTGIAYAGTVAIGQAVYHWTETGEKLKPAALREVYARAVEQGKEFGRSLLRRRKALPPPAEVKPKKGHCPHCGKRVPRDATWCPYCRQAVAAPPAQLEAPPGEAADETKEQT
jgi:uncharacterized protein (DUF697 family)